MFTSVLRILLLAAPLAFATAASSGTRVLTTGGTWIAGDLSFASPTATVGAAACPIDQLIAAQFSGESVDAVERAMLLQNGDVVAGVVRSVQAGKVQFASDGFGALNVPLEEVRGFVFTTHGLAGLAGEFAGVQLRNNDRVNGDLTWINEAKIGIDNGRRIVEVPRDRVALVACKSASKPAAARQCVRLRNGDRISGTLKALDARQAEMSGTLFGDVKIPARSVAALWNEHGACVSLSDLTAAEVKQVPQFSESFPHAVDRYSTGDFLSIDGVRYERGLNCHSHCELTYVLDGAYSQFISDVGIDDEAGPSGEAVVAFIGDNQTLFTTPSLRRGEAARTVKVPVTNVKRLRIQVQFGANDSSVGDSITFGWPVLVK